MPQLGLGLGLHKSSPLQSPLQQLVKASSWSINIGKATGTSPGINSPFTNPVIDLSGVVGKNLFDLFTPYTTLTDVTLSYIPTGLRVQNSILSASLKYATLELRGLTPLSQVSLSCKATAVAGEPYSTIRNSSNTILAQGVVNSTTTKFTITVPSDGIVRFRFHSTIGASVAGDVSYTEIQLELGSVATAYEPYGKANVLLTNFGATTSSGYVVESNAGKTFTMLKFDGTDDYGLASNLASLDITGTGDFAIACVFKTGAFNIGMILSKALNDSPTNAQYALFTINDALYLRLGGQTYPFGSVISTNTLYKCIVYRNSGVLKCKLNGVQIFSASNNVDVVSQPSFLVGAESDGVGGATTFTNIALGHLSIINGAIDPFEETKLIADWDRFCASTYGL